MIRAPICVHIQLYLFLWWYLFKTVTKIRKRQKGRGRTTHLSAVSFSKSLYKFHSARSTVGSDGRQGSLAPSVSPTLCSIQDTWAILLFCALQLRAELEVKQPRLEQAYLRDAFFFFFFFPGFSLICCVIKLAPQLCVLN